MNEFFEKISKNITDTGKVVTEKTKQVSESAKLNAKIVSSENTISTNYTILGKYYYENFKENPAEEVAEACNAITAANDAIVTMKAQLLSIKGLVKCTACDAECPIENNFCGKCGAALEKPEPALPEEELDITVELVEADPNAEAVEITAEAEEAEVVEE
ncbi:MAG: hypothetical protein IJ007_06975 [Oscillospiraceae bacterium]|nr:hypothetical protein [Oscillospiraceae bacterium]